MTARQLIAITVLMLAVWSVTWAVTHWNEPAHFSRTVKLSTEPIDLPVNRPLVVLLGGVGALWIGSSLLTDRRAK